MIIYDTTLRDGAQNKDINFTLKDKLSILELLDKSGIDYVELGWPGSNKKDLETFKEANKLKLTHTKISAFCSTKRKETQAKDDPNLKAIIESKAQAVSIFGKTWISHIKKQLKLSPNDNLKAIEESIRFLKQNNLEVFYDAEHFFDGYKDNKEYAMKCLEAAFKAGATTAILCDTNGGCMPQEILTIVKEVSSRFKNLGIHCHNDSGCAVANSIIASKLLTQIQGTMNGFGERCGNADLCQIIPNLELKYKIKTNFNLKQLKKVSDLVYVLANNKQSSNQPYVGKNAFAHKGGIHVDAITKGAVYEHISPEKVGNKRDIVLSDLSGAANVVEVLKTLGMKADKKDPRVKAMLSDIKDMESKGYDIQDLKAEKYLLMHKHFIDNVSIIKVEKDNWKITTGRKLGSEFSECNVKGKVDNKWYEENIEVKDGGPVDSAYQALKNIISRHYKEIADISLNNFKVMIAEDKGPESSVRVYIQFKNHKEEFATTGVSTNIIEASMEAIIKGFRYYLLKTKLRSCNVV